MSVILGRAMPDVRDGLKPVHRRILYAMHRLRLGNSGPFRKSARVVGEVLGKYHPHGDTAVYDALVRMAQSFSMSLPLVDGHGNFGSTDGDPAAAMRYTECRLSALCQQGLLADLDRAGDALVEFYPNFDSSETEPSVLPASFPNLLVNGAAGIAVGMATNIPPHNLREVVAACVALIRQPDMTDSELFALVPAPDFPTGGFILGTADAKAVYASGRGRVVIRACVHSETIHADGSMSRPSSSPSSAGDIGSGGGGQQRGKAKKREALVITELPYQVNKASLVAKIAALVNDKKLDGISDLRDESDRTGTRIVIELKRDAKAPIVLQKLFKKTALQSSFSANMMALDNGRFPKRLTLRQFLQRFIDFRRSVVRRRVSHDLAVAQQRLHLVDGYLTVLCDIDTVVSLIRNANDVTTAKVGLIDAFALSERQASAVLDLQLRRLTALEKGKLDAERAGLETTIAEHEAVLAAQEKLDAVIVEELKTVDKEYGIPRRSKILKRRRRPSSSAGGGGGITDLDSSSPGDQDGEDADNSMGGVEFDAYGLDMMDEIDEMTLIQNVQNVMTVTRHGYIKRMGTALFSSQNRGTRGKKGIGRLRAGDRINHLFTCMTHDSLIVISAGGVAFRLDAYKVPSGNTGSRGVPIFQLLPGVPEGEKTDIAAVIPIASAQQQQQQDDDDYLVLLSDHGFVKRLSTDQVARIDSRGKRVISLQDGDRLRFVKRCTERESVAIASQNGLVLRFRTDAAHLRSSGRMSRGVLSMRLADGDRLADMDVVPSTVDTDANPGGTEPSEGENEKEEDEEEDNFLLIVTKHGKGKRVRSDKFKLRSRNGKGLLSMKLASPHDSVVAVQTCSANDSVMLVASDGTLVRTRVEKIPVQNRASMGVRLQRLADDVEVVAVVVLKGRDFLGDEEEEEEDDEVGDDDEDENTEPDDEEDEDDGEAVDK